MKNDTPEKAVKSHDTAKALAVSPVKKDSPLIK
jgi:hypothetical protein